MDGPAEIQANLPTMLRVFVALQWRHSEMQGMIAVADNPTADLVRTTGAVAVLKRDFFARRIDAAFTLFPMMALELWCRALDAARPVAP